MARCSEQRNPAFAAARRALELEGVILDPFLSSNPDQPVYGLNLTCAYPFPQENRHAYVKLATRLSTVGPFVYVYSERQLHITVMTLISFAAVGQEDSALMRRAAYLREQLRRQIATVFTRGILRRIPTFEVELHSPVISRKAAILPGSNQTNELLTIREAVAEALRAEGPLLAELQTLGFRVPDVVHSTIMRFIGVPAHLESFLAAFDALGGEFDTSRLRITEILLTEETRPYMRRGNIVDRFPLGHR